MAGYYIHDCGVITPDGVYWGCGVSGHATICRHIIDMAHDENATKGSIILLGAGSVVIEDPDNEFVDYFFTDPQIETLKDILESDHCPDNLRECAKTALELHDGALEIGTYRYRRLPKASRARDVESET